MKQAYKMMDLLIASNRKLSETNETLTKTHIKSLTLIEQQTQNKDQLEKLCSEIQQWLLDKQHPTKKERYWIERIQKTFIKRGQ